MKLLFNYNEFQECLKQARIWNVAGVYKHKPDKEVLKELLSSCREWLDSNEESFYFGVGNITVTVEKLSEDYILNFNVTPLVYVQSLYMQQESKDGPITLGWS